LREQLDPGRNKLNKQYLTMIQTAIDTSGYQALAETGLRDAEALLANGSFGPCMVIAADVVECVIWSALFAPLVGIRLMDERQAHQLLAILLFESGPRHEDTVRRTRRFFEVDGRRLKGSRVSAWTYVTSQQPAIVEGYLRQRIPPTAEQAARAIVSIAWIRGWVESSAANLANSSVEENGHLPSAEII
jgi:hypothetical protein